MKLIQEIKDYYPYYLTVHSKEWTRRCHFIGVIMTFLFVGWCVTKHHFFCLPATPFIVYPFAWSSHLFIEKNEPATFKKNPIITKSCDLIMCWQMLTGKIKF